MDTDASLKIAAFAATVIGGAVAYLWREFRQYQRNQIAEQRLIREEAKADLAAAKVEARQRQDDLIGEIRADRDDARKRWEECEEGHVKTREDLAEMKGRISQQTDLQRLLAETLKRLEDRHDGNPSA